VEAIQRATDAVRGASRSGRVRVMCPPSFAINWLMPHLKAYFDQRGREDVDIVISRDLDTLRLGRAEIGIASGPRDFGDLPAEPLLRLRGAVVSAPVLACGRAPPRSFAELAEHRLLALAPPADLQHDLWAGWLRTSGHADAVLPEPIRFDTWALMYEAAAHGLGVAIAVPAVSEAYLQSGRLRPCFESRAELRVSYSLVFASAEVARRREVRELVAWLGAQMRRSETVFSELAAAA
jgi:LysR family glycine cleavage system transcriptional activator